MRSCKMYSQRSRLASMAPRSSAQHPPKTFSPLAISVSADPPRGCFIHQRTPAHSTAVVRLLVHLFTFRNWQLATRTQKRVKRAVLGQERKRQSARGWFCPPRARRGRHTRPERISGGVIELSLSFDFGASRESVVCCLARARNFPEPPAPAAAASKVIGISQPLHAARQNAATRALARSARPRKIKCAARNPDRVLN